MLPVRELIATGENRLADCGCPDPKIDAEWLYCYMINTDRSQLFRFWSQDVTDEQCDRYFELIDERASGMPLQYMMGWEEFMGLRFAVNEDVLIPRQDTETLVETVCGIIADKKYRKALDLCTGSGAIAISLYKYCSEKYKVQPIVAASDISARALTVARSNSERLKAPVKFYEGDLFAPFRKKLGKPRFDVIVSNPPYVPTDEIDSLQREIAEHEPRLALDGGADGLDFYRRIIAEAPDFLNKGGVLAIEIGSDQGLAVEGIAIETGKYVGSEIVKDLAGNDRVMILTPA